MGVLLVSTPGDKDFRQRIERVEKLLEEIQTHADPAVRATAEELVGTILDFHGRGLGRMTELLGQAGEAGQALLEQLAGDELVGSLLLLHDLHPLDVERRVRQALARLDRHPGAGKIELVRLSDGVVNLRVESGGHDCSSSARTVRQMIEEAIYAAAPEVTRVEIEGLPEPAGEGAATFVPVEDLVQRFLPATTT
jgi:Fe-S cluster biogenesis protein NfuA